MHAVQEELVVLDIEQDKTTTEEPTVQQSALPTLEEPEMSNGRSQEAREPVNNQQPAVEAVTPEAPSQQEPVTDNQKRMTRNGTPLFGRDKDITSICARLADPTTRILVVWGMYGVGTTEVAWQVGQEMSDKFVVKFVSLEKVDKPRLVLSKIAEALGTPTVRASSAVGAVVAWLNNLAQQRKEKSTPSTLVVLDPFEQVIDAYSDLLQLLGECPQLKLLVVSRTWQGKLGSIPPDHLYKMALLSCPNRADLVRLRQVELATLPKQLLNDYAAVALFVERAQKYHPTFAVTSENSMAIAEICCTLSGNPLSLTLAAEHMEDQTAEGLLKELFEDVLLIKAKGTYGWGGKPQTLKSSLNRSYKLLSEQEQQLFRELSVFWGDFSLEAAEAVCLVTEEPGGWCASQPGRLAFTNRDGLLSLSKQGLVQRIRLAGGESRYRMLFASLDYVQAIVGEPENAGQLRERYQEYYLRLLYRLATVSTYAEFQECWLREAYNIYTALQRSRSDAHERPEIYAAFLFYGLLVPIWFDLIPPTEKQVLTAELAANEGPPFVSVQLSFKRLEPKLRTTIKVSWEEPATLMPLPLDNSFLAGVPREKIFIEKPRLRIVGDYFSSRGIASNERMSALLSGGTLSLPAPSNIVEADEW